eukprot:scaffold14.g1217.t1
MSEEAVTVVEPAPVAEAAKPDAAPEAAEEQLVLPAERIKKPVRPDDSDVKKAIEALQATINKNKRRVEEIRELIEAKRSGRSRGSGEQQAIKNQLAEYRLKFQALVTQKQGVRAQLDLLAKSRETARQNINSMKRAFLACAPLTRTPRPLAADSSSSMKFTSVEQIDARIAELEGEIAHSSLSLNEEKNLLEQIKQLKKTRGSVGQLAAQMSQLTDASSSHDDLRETIKNIDEEINGVKRKEEELRAQLGELKAKEAEQGSDVPALIQQRDECREVCKAAYQKIQELRAEHDAEWDAYKRQNKLFRLQMEADRQRRQEQFLKERAERDAVRAARLAENMPEPFDKEVTTCEQLAAYLSKFVVAEAAAKPEEKREVAALEGFKPLEKKATDDSDAWLLGTGGKKGKGGKKGGKGGGGGGAAANGLPAAAPAAASQQRITHSIDIIESFQLLGLEVPTTAAKAAGLVPVVAEKKEHFLAKRQEVKDRGEGEAPAAPAEGGEAPAPEAAGPADAAAPAPKAGKKVNSKVAAPPQLDDAESWPSIGGAPAAAAPKPTEAAAEEEEEEAGEGEGEDEGEVAEPAEAEAEGVAAAGDGVSVTLQVSAEGSVSLSIAP